MRTLTVCTLSLLLFAACQDEPADPEATVPVAPEEVVEGTDELLGQWVIMEQDGEMPADLYYVTFTREGEYLVQDQLGSTKRSTFRPAGENLIAVTDSAGTQRYTYDVDGDRLTLSVPGTENETVLRRPENGI